MLKLEGLLNAGIMLGIKRSLNKVKINWGVRLIDRKLLRKIVIN